MSTLATPEQIREEQDNLINLNNHHKLKLEKKTELQEEFEKNDYTFVNHIFHQYDKQLEKCDKNKDVVMRKGLLMLGKWNFLKDWLDERRNEKVFVDLYETINASEKRFRELIPESEELMVHDFENLDVRRLKVTFANKTHIQEKKNLLTEHEQDLERLLKKKQSLMSQIDAADKKINDIKDLMRFQNVDIPKAFSSRKKKDDGTSKVLAALPVITDISSAKSSPKRKDTFTNFPPVNRVWNAISENSENEDDEGQDYDGEGDDGPHVFRRPSEVLWAATTQKI